MTLVTEANQEAGPFESGRRAHRDWDRHWRRTSPIGAAISAARAGSPNSAEDLAPAARDYVEAFAGPYFAAMAEWFHLLKIGTPGGKLSDLIADKLPFDRFGIFLNPGHLIHLDEWLSSPIYPGSDIPLEFRHGDPGGRHTVVPGLLLHKDGGRDRPGRCRAAPNLQTLYPACFARCQKRRAFMIDVLGIDLPEEVLPLSNMPAIVAPFFLRPNQIFAVR